MKTVNYVSMARSQDVHDIYRLVNKVFKDAHRSSSSCSRTAQNVYVYLYVSETMNTVELIIQNTEYINHPNTVKHILPHWHDIAHIPLMHNAILNSIQEIDSGS